MNYVTAQNYVAKKIKEFRVHIEQKYETFDLISKKIF